MQEPLHLDGISHKMSCKLLKQLETNCWKIPPRDTWQEKREMARNLGAKLHLFPSQSVRNSKFLFCRCRATVWAHTSAGCRWLCPFTFPLCTGTGIIGYCSSHLNCRNTSGLFPLFSFAAWTHQLFTYHPLSISSPTLYKGCVISTTNGSFLLRQRTQTQCGYTRRASPCLHCH